jgi:hypothetical protein
MTWVTRTHYPDLDPANLCSYCSMLVIRGEASNSSLIWPDRGRINNIAQSSRARYEKFEDTKEVIRNSKSIANRKMTIGLTMIYKTLHKTTDWATQQISPTTGAGRGGGFELSCPRTDSSFFSTSGTCLVALATNPAIMTSYEERDELWLQTELWHSFVVTVNQVMMATI